MGGGPLHLVGSLYLIPIVENKLQKILLMWFSTNVVLIISRIWWSYCKFLEETRRDEILLNQVHTELPIIDTVSGILLVFYRILCQTLISLYFKITPLLYTSSSLREGVRNWTIYLMLLHVPSSLSGSHDPLEPSILLRFSGGLFSPGPTGDFLPDYPVSTSFVPTYKGVSFGIIV